MNDKIILVTSTIITWLENFLGGFDSLITALLIFMIAKLIANTICFAINKNQNIKTNIKEILKMIFIFILIGISNTIDVYITHTCGFLRTSVILFYIYCMGKSIFEIAKSLGISIPTKLKSSIKELYDNESNSSSNESTETINDNPNSKK